MLFTLLDVNSISDTFFVFCAFFEQKMQHLKNGVTGLIGRVFWSKFVLMPSVFLRGFFYYILDWCQLLFYIRVSYYLYVIFYVLFVKS